MTEQELQAIREREQAASEGPWRWTRTYQLKSGLHWCIEGVQDKGATTCRYPLVSIATDPEWAYFPDPQFMAHARQDILALLAELDAATQAIHDLQQESDAYRRGREAALSEVLACLRTYRNRADAEANRAGFGDTVELGRVQAGNILIDSVLKMAGLGGGESPEMLPPDQVRDENARLRKVILDAFEAMGIAERDRILADALGLDPEV